MPPKALGRIIPDHAAPIVISRLMAEEGITRSQAIFRIWTHNVEARQNILRQNHRARQREREQPADWAWREVQEATEGALR